MNKIDYSVEIQGLGLTPTPIVMFQSQGNWDKIKVYLRIKLQLFLPARVTNKKIPTFYKSDDLWLEITDQESQNNFIKSGSRIMMVNLESIKETLNLNTFIKQLQIHIVQAPGKNTPEQTQLTNPTFIQGQSMTCRNSNIRILSAFTYQAKDEIKFKIEQAGQDFKKQLNSKIEAQLIKVSSQFSLDACKKKVNELDHNIEKLNGYSQNLVKELKQMLSDKNIDDQFKLKNGLTTQIDICQREIDRLQNNIIKLEEKKNQLCAEQIERIKIKVIQQDSEDKSGSQGGQEQFRIKKGKNNQFGQILRNYESQR